MIRFRLPLFSPIAPNYRASSVCACALFLFAFATVDAARDQMPAGLWQARSGDLRLQILPKNRIRFFADQNTTAFEVQFDTEATVRREYWFAVDSIKSVEHKVQAPKDPKPQTRITKPGAAAPGQKSAANDTAKQSARPETQQPKPGDKKNESNKTGNPKQPAQKQAAAKTPPANKGPLRLGWLTKDAKIILSFLTEYPPPAAKKEKAKKKPTPSTKAADTADPKSVATDSPKSEKNVKEASASANQRQPNTGAKSTQQSVAKSPGAKTPAPKTEPRKKQAPRGPMPIVELLVFQNGKLVHEAIFERDR